MHKKLMMTDIVLATQEVIEGIIILCPFRGIHPTWYFNKNGDASLEKSDATLNIRSPSI